LNGIVQPDGIGILCHCRNFLVEAIRAHERHAQKVRQPELLRPVRPPPFSCPCLNTRQRSDVRPILSHCKP
jgi:hypothetical protein